uniref:Uncharacterized protein n=1 Tax=Candidatus Kentrum sp. LFY TaxID=2126342 RepID=A0A450UKW2_9GAMM|nr:MAG: hypothetical protein BECKLFY1418B_GA0070995_104224 [Candidatus Kentron sp. LFY]
MKNYEFGRRRCGWRKRPEKGGERKGEERGRKEGERKKAAEIARAALARGSDVDMVAEISGPMEGEIA